MPSTRQDYLLLSITKSHFWMDPLFLPDFQEETSENYLIVLEFHDLGTSLQKNAENLYVFFVRCSEYVCKYFVLRTRIAPQLDKLGIIAPLVESLVYRSAHVYCMLTRPKRRLGFRCVSVGRRYRCLGTRSAGSQFSVALWVADVDSSFSVVFLFFSACLGRKSRKNFRKRRLMST